MNSAFCHVCYTVWYVYNQYGLTATLTSANDGIHMEGSLHYKNLAWDFRIWGIPDPKIAAAELHRCLNAKHQDYDVVVESDHIHVEYDPKEGTVDGQVQRVL